MGRDLFFVSYLLFIPVYFFASCGRRVEGRKKERKKEEYLIPASIDCVVHTRRLETLLAKCQTSFFDCQLPEIDIVGLVEGFGGVAVVETLL